MKRPMLLSTRLFAILWLALSMLTGTAEEIAGFDSVDGPNVQVFRQPDGARTIFQRSPDNRTMTRRHFSAQRRLEMLTVYRLDAHGNPMSCKIHDGQGTELYKVSYGYHRSDGRLVEERMFDSRERRIDPRSGLEMPVRRFIYTYDAEGRQNKPLAIVLVPGRDARDVYGPTAYERDPFSGRQVRQRQGGR